MHFVIHIDLHFYSINVNRLQGNIKIRDNPTEDLDHLKIKVKTHTGTQVPAGMTTHEHRVSWPNVALVSRLCLCICIAVCQNSFGLRSREHRSKTWQYWKMLCLHFSEAIWTCWNRVCHGMRKIKIQESYCFRHVCAVPDYSINWKIKGNSRAENYI